MAFPKYNLRQTSGGLLIEMLADRASADDAPADARRRYEIACDVYIKQWSYAVFNKVFFWLSLLTSIAVLLWPVVLAFLNEYLAVDLIEFAVTQTMVTAVSGLFIALYLHYKVRQTSAETLLRAIAFSDLSTEQLAAMAMEELSRIDQGVRFQQSSRESE